MRTFHTGGVASGGDITQGLPRVEEVFEARTPKGRAVVADEEGVVQSIIEEKEGERVIQVAVSPDGKKTSKRRHRRIKGRKVDDNIREYEVLGNMAIWIKKGDLIGPGTQLTEGNMDLKELFEDVGIEQTQRYIINEVEKIYTSQGASIHDKHIEVIIRQMFSRVYIEEGGDSSFTPGEIVERAEVLETNNALRKANKKEVVSKPLLLGITKVALTTTSFLSAASFQETARVLIEAAVKGKKDILRGLKENVIIGKLIPAGTGFRKK
jgi:DNA-directed RNA polymerase subunit beta'